MKEFSVGSDSQLVAKFFAIGRLLQESCRVHQTNKTFSLVKLEVMRLVADRPTTMKQLADHLSITAPSATHLVNQLVQGKLLRRQFDNQDRRQVNLAITPAGRQLLIKHSLFFAQTMAKMTDALNQQEKVSLGRLLDKIINRYQIKRIEK